MGSLNPNRFVIFFLILISSQVCLHNLYGQNENELWHPTSYNGFHSIQILPDSGIRVFAKSGYSEYSSYNQIEYADILTGYSLDSMNVVRLDIPGHWFNHLVWYFYTLHFKDGSTLLGNNQFDCDYFPPGGLLKLTKEGTVDWFRDFILEEIYFEQGEMVFLDSARIHLNGFYPDIQDKIIDRHGNFLSYVKPDSLYDETRETPSGYLARLGNRLQLLDTNFHPTFTYDLDFDIVEMHTAGNNEFLIRTDGSYYHLDSTGQLYVLPISVNQFGTVWLSKEFYWLASSNQNAVIQLDTQFMPVDTHLLPPGISPVFGIVQSGEMTCIAEYYNNFTKGIVTYKGAEENIDFELPQDIGITSVEIPDTVLVEYINAPWGGGWIHHYEYINVEVTNFGQDTVFNYLIQGDDISQCFWCYSGLPIWVVDSFPIAPGATVKIALGSFVPDCLQSDPGMICLSTVSPNLKADGNYLNDRHCDTYSVLVPTKELPDKNEIHFGPNPAQDYVNIIIDTPNNQKIKFIDVYGRQVMDVQMSSSFEEINIEHLPAGLYSVLVSNDDGMDQSFKLSIVR